MEVNEPAPYPNTSIGDVKHILLFSFFLMCNISMQDMQDD